MSSITRRRFVAVSGITLASGCGGGGNADPAAPVTASAPGASTPSPNPTPTPAPETPPQAVASSPEPVKLVIEDHRQPSAVRDVGVMMLDRLLTTDRFASSALKTVSSGWQEFGRSGAAIVFDGIEFDAWRFSVNQDGIYATAAQRILVLMRSTDLTAHLWGSPLGKRTYAPPFKIRVEDAQGNVLKLLAMRDGLPINSATLNQTPTFLSDEPALKAQAMRRHVCVGMALPIYFGSEPLTPTAVQNFIPRAKTGASKMPSYLPKARATVNGAEMLIAQSGNTGGNGNAHPYVMPQWALSRNQMSALGNSLPTQDPELVVGSNPLNWESALAYGWDYEPGALGGITNRGGPGGIRGDRAAVPAELLQMYLTEPSGSRSHDGAPHEKMARAFLRNHWNYPTFRHAGKERLTAIDGLRFPYSAPMISLGLSDPRPQIVANYYARGNTSFEDPNQTPNAIWSVDEYGENDGTVWEKNRNPLDNRHPTGGWGPDSEHANRMGGVWGSYLTADPIYARMQEFLMSEVAMDYPAMDQSVTDASYFPFGMQYSAEQEFPQLSRSVVLRWCNLAAMWACATEQGLYPRSLCEERLRALAGYFYRQYAQAMPADDNTVARLAWHRFAANIEWDSSEGWVMEFPIYSQYIAEFILVAKAFGLWEVLRNQGSAAEQTACRYWLDQCLLHASNLEQWMVRCPWHVSSTDSGQLRVVMRTPAQGANQTLVSTIPTTWGAIALNAPANLRTDGAWHVDQAGDRRSQANYMREMSLKIAFIACEYGRPRNDPLRASHLTVLNQRLQAIDAYVRSKTTDPRERAGEARFALLLHAWPQSVPALDI